MPDSVFGEQVIAFIVPTSPDETDLPNQIASYSREHLGSYKIPRQFISVEQLPRNPSGKILKTQLREMAADHLNQNFENIAAATDDPETTPVNLKPATLQHELKTAHASERNRVAVGFLQQLVKTICDQDNLPEANLSFIEARPGFANDRRIAAQLQLEVGQESELPATLIFDYPKISDMADFLVQKLSPQDCSSLSIENDSPIPVNPPDLQTEIEQMSEDEALRELLKELG